MALVGAGMSYQEVAAKLNMSHKTVSAIANLLPSSDGADWEQIRREDALPLPGEVLSPEAERALVDFAYFRRRYFGRVHMPWQSEAAYELERLVYTPEKEFVVFNAPPGAGKTSLTTHDLLAWMVCRNRAVRVLVGARTLNQAMYYTDRLRKSFERLDLAHPKSEDLRKGLAVTPTGVLAMDFGRFKPIGRMGRWAAGAFVVAQPDDLHVVEKEPTVAAYGMDSGFLGGRFDVVLWDDLVDRKTFKTLDALEALIEVYEDEMETRVEPGGLLVLQGQRMAPNDLYRHALDMQGGDFDDWDEDDGPAPVLPAKYRHLVFKAHYEEHCEGRATHRGDPPPWQPPARDEGVVLRGLFGYPDPPQGCLLDPKRLRWAELSAIKAGRGQKFAVLYQQEDVDSKDVLVPRIWIDGGLDPVTGEEFPGCWDKGRGVADPPKNLTPPVFSYCTVDPSPTRYWCVQWWLFQPASNLRFLLDLKRGKMDAPEFLDWHPTTQRFSGLAEEWQLRSDDLGFHISHWVMEHNAAQRFMSQYEFFVHWKRLRHTAIQAHQTQRNKTHEDYGVEMLANLYRYGLVRLPTGGQYHGDRSRLVSLNLVDEVTHYPDSSTTNDCVMAQWFGEYQLQKGLFRRETGERPPQRRPSWLRSVPMRERVG